MKRSQMKRNRLYDNYKAAMMKPYEKRDERDEKHIAKYQEQYRKEHPQPENTLPLQTALKVMHFVFTQTTKMIMAPLYFQTPFRRMERITHQRRFFDYAKHHTDQTKRYQS